MNRLLRPLALAAAIGGVSTAHANIEIGGTAGLHVFSSTNELGVVDVPTANSIRNSALFGLRIGAFFGDLIGIEGELGVIPSESDAEVFDVWSLTYRAHLVAQFRAAKPENKLVPFVLVGAGLTQIVQSKGEDKGAAAITKDEDAALYAGIGAKYRVDNGWGLRIDGRILFPPSSKDDGFTQDYEVLLSIYKELGRRAPAPPPEPVDDDPDRDNIRGDADKCPNEPEDMDGFQDEDGCPDLDNDGDGIPDVNDKCPNEPEDMDGFQDEDGCPDPDNDGDGILDGADQCPNEPEDADGFQDDDGCPDPDNDGDGVLDAADQCPTEPETKNGFQDEDGCPDEIPTQLKQFTGVIAGINFKVSSSDLVATSNRTLDKAVAVLTEFPDLKLEIQGHTDDQPLKAGGKFADNTALSQARAESVKAYFVAKGIDEARLTARGFGESQPAVDPTGLKGGKLTAARAKNRRVEFKLISPLDTAAPAAPAPAPAPAPPAPTP